MSTHDSLAALSGAELLARWAALVAYVEDVHQPQDNLDEESWAAAERTLSAMSERHHLVGDDRILFNALGSMLDQFDPPDMDEAGWVAAETLLAAYTQALEDRKDV